jgi:hypothetical protein
VSLIRDRVCARRKCSFVHTRGGGVTHSRLTFAANPDTVAEDKKQPYASLRDLLLGAESLTQLVTLSWSSHQGNLVQPNLMDKTFAFAKDGDHSSPQQSGKKKSKKTDSANSYGTTSSSREAALERQCELLRIQLNYANDEVYNLKLENLHLRDALFGLPDDLPTPLPLVAGSDQQPAVGDEFVVEACGQAPLPQGSGSGKRRWEGDEAEAEAEAEAEVELMDHDDDQPLDVDTLLDLLEKRDLDGYGEVIRRDSPDNQG